MIKKAVCILISVMTACSFAGCKKKGATFVYDNSGKLIATITDLDNIKFSLKADSRRFFVEYAINEAIEVIKSKNNCDDAEAKDFLRKEIAIHTTLDENIFNQIEKYYEGSNIGKTDFGCAITDVNGTLLATYSNSERDCSSSKVKPHSAFKPLSVYAPAIDNNTVNWSTLFDDSPYKKINTDNSGVRDWPSNADGKYSMKKVCVCDAIAKSLNTVAVKCLSKYGVMNSVEFLQNNFGLSLQSEQKRASLKDEDEIIGNIALGSISGGCSPIDMAGYYQIFANGGIYTKPHSITAIKDKSQNSIYNYSPNSKRVIKDTTAYIMNKMLQGVLTAVDSTGKDAQIKGVLAGGKTGTGDSNDGNWFVGFTPEYVCSVWHGKGLTKNISPAIFCSVMKEVTKNSTKRNFDIPAGIEQQAYCKESGKLLTYNCNSMDVGYYASDNIPKICETH